MFQRSKFRQVLQYNSAFLLLAGVSLVASKFASTRSASAQSTNNNNNDDSSSKESHPQQQTLFKIKPDSRLAPTRAAQLQALRQADSNGAVFDVLVIGGGATGTGIALDCAQRGLKCVMIDRDDYASGTSSRSTKLIHGGVRYLEAAFKQLDVAQGLLVFEALKERSLFLKIAPHLSHPLPIMTPVYTYFDAAYYWCGLKFYDLIARIGAVENFGIKAMFPRHTAGQTGLYSSQFLSGAEASRRFPMLAQTGEHGTLKGACMYYDGQFNDSRMAVALAITASSMGAIVVNHCQAASLMFEPSSSSASGEVVRGAVCIDRMTGDLISVRANVVINATGPFVDDLREIEHFGSINQFETAESTTTTPSTLTTKNEKHRSFHPLIRPSSGVHVVLPDYASPDNCGMIIPKTNDGRVIFMLPWEGFTIVGTTDNAAPVTHEPRPRRDEVEYLLDTLSQYLVVRVRHEDVLSTFSGIRPLAVDPASLTDDNTDKQHTARLSRNHVIDVGPRGMVTITGGKWTTYRRMAEDCVDVAIKQARKNFAILDNKANNERALSCEPAKCRTQSLTLIGGVGFDRALFTRIAQENAGLPTDVAKYLCHNYGTNAIVIANIASQSSLATRLAPTLPFIEAEVPFAVAHEHASTLVDVIARRTRLAFLDVAATERALPRIGELMQQQLSWSDERLQSELHDARIFLRTMTTSRHAIDRTKTLKSLE